jgi:hypothetical protein
MAKITNTSTVAVPLNEGSLILGGQTLEREDWADLKQLKNVQSYLEQGILVVNASKAEQVEAAEAAPSPVPAPAPYRK